ncbi:cytochrome c peroxidase [Rapidithrix thailandica]|uniref:Cytochrome c peroxidase n=1 Tax=Rapidithrix thailandica TaxID=413964 RepID=A0AAW9SFG4_9BACT
MSRRRIRVLVMASISLWVITAMLAISCETTQQLSPPPEKVKHLLTQYIDQLNSQNAQLVRLVEQNADTKAIQKAFKQARLAYKKVEPLTEMYFPATAKSLNGPALDEVETDDPNQVVIPPEGYQVVEELLFPEFTLGNRDVLLKELNIVQSNIQRLHKIIQTTNFIDGNIFIAFRMELFRIITLGISGFDSPIALHSLPEAQSAMEGLQAIYTIYQPLLSQKQPELAKTYEHQLSLAIAYLKQHQSFNTFDRMQFITECINPLSSSLLDVQEALAIQPFEGLYAINPQAKTLFEQKAFNLDYYAPQYSREYLTSTVDLGKKLFFDPVLSGNGQRSCGTCHQPDKGYADGLVKSPTIDLQHTVSRNAPSIINAGLQRFNFYDSRVVYLEDQVKDVVSNKEEMHGSLQEAVVKMNSDEKYLPLFKEAFGDGFKGAIEEKQLKTALANFIRSTTSLDSRFDQYMRGDKTQLNPEEIQGFNLFMGKAKCGTCHFMPVFNGTVPPNFAHTESEVLGVPTTPDTVHATVDPDLGKYNLHHIDLHRHAFKTPTVRNVDLTAPYMHNGVYRTLEEVMDFYNRGGGKGIGIDLPNQTLPEDPLNLTPVEQQAIIAFMKALTSQAIHANELTQSVTQ